MIRIPVSLTERAFRTGAASRVEFHTEAPQVSRTVARRAFRIVARRVSRMGARQVSRTVEPLRSMAARRTIRRSVAAAPGNSATMASCFQHFHVLDRKPIDRGKLPDGGGFIGPPRHGPGAAYF